MATCSINIAQHLKSLTELVRTLDCCRALVGSSQSKLRIFPLSQTENNSLKAAEVSRCNEVISEIGHRFQLPIPQFVCPVPNLPSSLEVALSRFCKLGTEDWQRIAKCPSINDLIDNVKAAFLEKLLPVPHTIISSDKTEIEVLASGIPSHEAIILVPPCAVPLKLFQPWLESLAVEYFVIISQNPYFFGDWSSRPEPASEISDEVDRIGTILREYGITQAHLIGICGGAPIALAAAAQLGKQIASLIICHGDLNFGPKTPRTAFHEQFQGFLSESVHNASRAKEVLALFHDPSLLYGVADQLGPFILYPYSDLKLFQRYAKVNSLLMMFNVSELTSKLMQPLMIVTSRDDRMTHPAVSHMLHDMVEGSYLWERTTGNHQDALLGGGELFSAILQFTHHHRLPGYLS